MRRRPTRATRRLPKAPAAKVTLEAILEATEREVERVGFGKLTTNHVAARAGVSIGTLYHYVPNREALVEAMLNRAMARENAQFARALAELAPGTPPFGAVRHLVARYLELVVARPAFYARWYRETPHLGDEAAGRALTRGAAAALAPLLGFAATDPDVALRIELVIAAAIFLARRTALAEPAALTDGRLARELERLACRYLGVPEEVA